MTKKLSKILSICVFSAILIALLIFGSFFLFDDDKKDQFQNNEITSTATGFWTGTGNWAVPTKRTMIGTTYYAYIETPQHLAWLSYRVNSEMVMTRIRGDKKQLSFKLLTLICRHICGSRLAHLNQKRREILFVGHMMAVVSQFLG